MSPFMRLATALLAGAALAHAQVLRNFQVAAPPAVPKNAKTCQVTVVDHTFGASYYQPALKDYTPPTDCGPIGSWAAITLNITVTSNGTQFDRLAILTLQDTEIWRTSTSEPTRAGIIWTYLKDVSKYIPIFSKPGVLNMELNNVLDDRYTGLFATKVIATFYASSSKNPPAGKADLIVPIGVVRADGGAEVSVPPAFTKTVTLPKNTVKIYAELYASGNSQEEFWYFNVPDQYLGDFPDGFTYGNGPFREVRILVDGQLAGFAFPYATFFTGAWVPLAWRPIPGYGAYDLPTYFVDLTPFAPIFADGLPHNVTIDVGSTEADHAINNNWYLSANLQVVTDPSGKQTTGKITSYSAPAYATGKESLSTGTNGDLNVTVTATHDLRIAATVKAGSGKTTDVLFTQNLRFENFQSYLNDYNLQGVKQTSKGAVLSLHNGIPVLSDVFQYPVDIQYVSFNENGTSYRVTFDQSYDRVQLPTPYILGTTIKNHQVASGYFTIASTGNFGNGTNDNSFSYVDLKGNTYHREVGAALNNITYDRESGSLAPSYRATQLPMQAPLARLIPEQYNYRLPGGRHP